LSYGENAGFWAISEMVKQRCGIVDGDDEHTARTRLRTALVEYVPSEDDRAWMEPKLESLLGIGVAAAERAELFAAWRLFFTTIAQQGPVVLVFEDLHWADDGVLDFIQELVEVAADTPILVLTLARPQLTERRVGWGQGRANSVSIHLAPLAPRTMAQLLLGVVPDAPGPLVDQMVERSGGVPLYAVEMMRMLLDRGAISAQPEGTFAMSAEVGGIDIPDSLHGLVGARLDQFDAEARALIADAAILGQSFRIEALMAFRDDDPQELRAALDALVRTEVLSLNRDPRSPERGQYQFVQSIIREVAHDRVSRADRLRLHTAVAEFYESLDEPELSGVVASHWLDAVEAAGSGDGAERVRAKASESLLAAADRADLLGSYAQVVVLCLRGVELADAAADRAHLLARAARAAHSALDDQARDLSKRAIDEASSSGDPDARLFATWVWAKLLDDLGESHEAWPALLAVLEEFPGETPLHAAAIAELARGLMMDDRDGVFEWAERGLELAERLGLVQEVAELWATKGAALSTRARTREAEVILRAALDLAREHQLLRTKRRAMANLNYISFSLHDPFAEERLEDARRLGDKLLLQEALMAKAGVAFTLLEVEESERILAELEAMSQSQLVLDAVAEFRMRWRQLRGEPEVAAAWLEQMWERQGPGDQQNLWNRDMSRATAQFYMGNHRKAFDMLMVNEHPSPQRFQFNWALVAALCLKEREPLEQLLLRNEESVPGDLRDLRLWASRGALASLDGDRPEAWAAFERAGKTAKELWGPIYGGFIRVAAYRFVDPNPTILSWVEESKADWERADATTLLDLYSDVFGAFGKAEAHTA
jgi:tetratricopeptide (TPR) repeat protein